MTEIELAELVYEKRRLRALLKIQEVLIEEGETELLRRWNEAGTTQMKVRTQFGPYVLYCSTRTYAKLEFVETAAVYDRFPSLLSVNHAKSGSLLNEYMALGNEEGLAELAAVGITPNEITKINVKKG